MSAAQGPPRMEEGSESDDGYDEKDPTDAHEDEEKWRATGGPQTGQKIGRPSCTCLGGSDANSS